jgi:hypothetical protein
LDFLHPDSEATTGLVGKSQRTSETIRIPLAQICLISDLYFLIHGPLPLNRIVRILMPLPRPPRSYLSPMETRLGSNLILNRQDALSSKAETAISVPSVSSAAGRDEAMTRFDAFQMFMEPPIASQSPILLTGLPSKSYARNPDILGSLG